LLLIIAFTAALFRDDEPSTSTDIVRKDARI
jgi:hypothetical protein